MNGALVAKIVLLLAVMTFAFIASRRPTQKKAIRSTLSQSSKVVDIKQLTDFGNRLVRLRFPASAAYRWTAYRLSLYQNRGYLGVYRYDPVKKLLVFLPDESSRSHKGVLSNDHTLLKLLTEEGAVAEEAMGLFSKIEADVNNDKLPSKNCCPSPLFVNGIVGDDVESGM